MTENGADGSSTVGMGYCLSRELEYWDARLNIAYKLLRDVDRAEDAELAAVNSSAPIRAKALRDMQRSWIGYRDAACFYDYSEWGGGTGGGPAHAACLMRITGVQALRLEEKLEGRK
ncbi:MAG: lysozyme inhibitor LprI family protein [Boseongicola sp.]